MRHPLAAATTALALALALAACGGDDTSSAGSSAAATTAAATAASTTAAPTTATPTTTAASSTAPPTTAPPTTAAPTTAAATTAPVGSIVVDADNDPVRTVTVPLGTPVTITVLSATPREFHLHGYDLEQAGTKVVFEFTADLAGAFDLEAHDNEQVVLVLEVA
jgi:hypothetical protein